MSIRALASALGEIMDNKIDQISSNAENLGDAGDIEFSEVMEIQADAAILGTCASACTNSLKSVTDGIQEPARKI